MIDIQKYLDDKYKDKPIDNQYYHVPNVYLNKVIIPIFNEFVYKAENNGRKPAYISGTLENGWYMIQPINSPISNLTVISKDFDLLLNAIIDVVKQISNLKRKIESYSFKFKYKRYFFIYKKDIVEYKNHLYKFLKEVKNNKSNESNWDLLYNWLRFPTFPIYIRNINSYSQMERLETLSKLIRKI